MKRKVTHPQPAEAPKKRYWRSMDEFASTPEFKATLEQEFPQGAAEYNGTEVSRRSFLHLMGASVALAGLSLTGCRRPEIDIVSYSKSVEWQIPGKALRYATAMPRRGGAAPVLATSYNGRPTKLEGNAVAGFNGTTDAFTQASILDLYDPDRSKTFLRADIRGSDYSPMSKLDFQNAITDIRRKYQANQGSGLAFIVEPTTSPTRQRLAIEMKRQFPNMLWVEYEPWALQNQALSLGNHLPIYHFDKADVILALDCDFLGAGDGDARYISGFAAGRRKTSPAQETMSRLYAVESRLTLTGGMADHRLRLASSGIGAFAIQLFKALGGQPLQNVEASTDPTVNAWITELVNELNKSKGRCLVVTGSQQAPVVQTVVAQINELLGNTGQTVEYGAGFISEGTISLPALATQMHDGSVDTLFVLGGNPAFNGHVDLDLAHSLLNVGEVIHHGLFINETTATSTMHIPATHFLESWGDSALRDLTYLTQQPLILPLYDGISEIDLLAMLLGMTPAQGAERIQETFAKITNLDPASGKPFDDAWYQCVHDGVSGVPTDLSLISDVTYPKVLQNVAIDPGLSRQGIPAPLPSGSYELTFALGNVDDGRYANNAWLQELPDPVSKLTWENVLYVSQKTARELGVEVLPNNSQDLPNTDIAPDDADPGLFPTVFGTYHTIPRVKITVPGPREGFILKDVPVLVAPGQNDQTLTLAIGWGMNVPRLTSAAKDASFEPLRVANGSGVNAYLLRTVGSEYFNTEVKVAKIEGSLCSLAIAQEHNSMEGRGLVREASLDEYHKNPGFVQDIGIDKEVPQGEQNGFQKYESAYTPPELNSATYNSDRPAWGMTIDLNTCVGCSTCMVACQAENNIPVVGKWQVLRGREMHWIRMDRYYGTDVSKGDPRDSSYLDEPQMLFQPMACQQCEIAPCEPVCPVNATIHNEEGLNVMAYNRCIGTRYCANNCPYKVRRFNFFNYNDRPIENVKIDILGSKAEVGELFLGPLAGKNGPLTEKGIPDSLQLQKNPNVTVRIRGVIEKCTYCVQRIEEAKIAQLVKSNEDGQGSGNITLPTDSFKTACQQACPAEAITFGNLNDPKSQVSINKQDLRNYGVLAYLGTRPRTTYLGRVRNPNPAMPGAASIGHTSRFHEDKPDSTTDAKPEGSK